ncbi:serine/threonine-protein kinase [Clostridium beijerinckii]|uniref:serine/threonine-protein kinase n=1 Tax=Clostridium beijerinckii TaxID=1520 RepID=UPI0013610E82|nr:serine/threonine-protein kinase [Clostridium beijerinckii]MZK49043.1 protein kinase [Clostridium beijerinckii]MZK57418.1 protein kinase [Clostridium beijerinckii]MZK67629.1 protein kinase [Clostridium beijerinckii]MZK72714.1 protein kinase [Clostridium beijerinckii]MZK82310.1 protein kinase [Clostridium beijerinckii]
MLNNYEQVRIIKPGTDSYSEVREVKDRITGKSYVTKIIKGIKTPLHYVVFQREVGSLTKLRTCDNIVRLEHFDTYNDEQYEECGRIFLEYIYGENLEQTDVLELSTFEKYKIIEQLINAIQIAHENNIIHRDINPKNIMLTYDKQVKLIDFGISKIKDMVNNDTVYQFATNRYASPEVHLHSENATEQSDIYSLGAVFYYIFTGEEPPIANEFEERIINVSGIDVELKQIICKMIKYSPSERYKNIFEVKKALLLILSRFTKADKTFIFTIATGTLEHMKNMSLVPNGDTYTDILEKNIYEDFLESYIFIENENNDDEKYVIYGLNYSFECVYKADGQLFQVVKVNKLQPHIREDKKKKAMFLNGTVKFILIGKKVLNNNNFELTIDVKNFKKEYLSSSNVNNEYTKSFFSWHKLLEIMEEECKNKAIKISYFSHAIQDNNVIFKIDEKSYYSIDDNKKDINFIFENAKKSKNKIIEIGCYESSYMKNEEFFLKISFVNKTSLSKLPKNGMISEDYRKNFTLIKREKNAINDFNNENYISSTNLKSIFSGVQTPAIFNAPQKVSFLNTKLDGTQKKAVEKALNSQDICLIQGPPGTGKTNVIIEIIRQIFELNKMGSIFKQKVLLVSQAHPAVDKMLEDLDEVTANNSNKVIRIGRSENLTDMVKQKYAVDYAQLKWVERIIDNSNKFADSMLAYLNLDKDEFIKYCEAQIIIDTVKSIEDKEYNKGKMIIDKFEDKYADILNKKEFQALKIQRDWINRINGRTDVQQHFVKNAEIVSGTCTGFISNNIIKDMVFDYVIIDEAAKATFPELLISIIRGKKIIMVGDHKQLPPILDEELIKNNKDRFNESNLDYKTLYDSIFMKLFDHIPKENRQTLNTQYRMHPAIGSMISKIFYGNDILNGVDETARKHNIKEYENLAILWIDTSKCNDRYEYEKDKVRKTNNIYKNYLEASIVKEQLGIISKSIKENKYDVGIITAYKGQKELIQNEIQSIVCNNSNDEIAVNSVDAFQGGQKDIIIYSTVRSSDKHQKIGFLKSEPRLNVAFSRAKRLLIIVGDAQFLNDAPIEDNKFPDVIEYIKSNREHCKIVDYSMIKNR